MNFREFTVYDFAFGKPPAAPFQKVKLEIGDTRAHYRAFHTTQATRVYQFRPDDSHVATQEELSRQLKQSEYLGKSEFDANSRNSERMR